MHNQLIFFIKFSLFLKICFSEFIRCSNLTLRPDKDHVCVFVFLFLSVTQSRVPGSESFHHIIGGSDLLVHNRGKNSDLDEWLKDAAEVLSPLLFVYYLIYDFELNEFLSVSGGATEQEGRDHRR